MDKARKARLLELRQKKIANRSQTDSQRHAEFLGAISGLHELFNETAAENKITTDALLKKLEEFSSFKKEVSEVKKAIEALPKVDRVAISNISELIENQRKLDLTEVTRTINNLAKAVQANSVEDVTIKNKKVDEYVPIRRVIQLNGRLVFDDKPMEVTVVGGGGGTVAGVQPELVRTGADGKSIAVVNPDGTPLSVGGGGGDLHVYNEIPGGAIDGVNDTFTTYYNYKPVTLRVYLNGVRQLESGDYIETGDNTLEFIATPQNGDSVIIDYIRQ